MTNLPISYGMPSHRRSAIAPVPKAGSGSEIPLATAAWFEFPKGSRPSFKAGDFWLSRMPSGEPVGLDDDRHILVCGGTRGGKGVSYIVPNLCLWPGSAVVIDPKGENAMVTARRRANGSRYCTGIGQKVVILDPFGAVGTPEDDFFDLKAAFNPLDLLDPSNPDAVRHADRISDAVTVAENTSDPFWEDSARGFKRYAMLHVASWKGFQPHERNLVTVRNLITAGDAEARAMLLSVGESAPSALMLLFSAMKRNKAYDGIVANAGERYASLLASTPRTLANILQVACTNTDFIDEPAMRRCLARSDFALSELKTDPKGMSLYLCLPQNDMRTHYRWLRMMITLITSEMERVKFQPRCGHRVLMVLDEFAGLGRMRSLENAAAQIAGFGVKMLFSVQHLGQLKDIYRDNWEGFVSSAGVRVFFGNDDHFTRDYVSKLIGECEVVRTTRTTGAASGSTSGTSNTQTHGVNPMGQRSDSTATGHSTGKSSSENWGTAETIHKRPLVTPDEVGRIFGDATAPAALVLLSGQQPLYVRRTAYFRDEMFAGLYDRHADHPPPPDLAELQRRPKPKPPEPKRPPDIPPPRPMLSSIESMQNHRRMEHWLRTQREKEEREWLEALRTERRKQLRADLREYAKGALIGLPAGIIPVAALAYFDLLDPILALTRSLIP